MICITDIEIGQNSDEQKWATVRVLLIIFPRINTLFNFITLGEKWSVLKEDNSYNFNKLCFMIEIKVLYNTILT